MERRLVERGDVPCRVDEGEQQAAAGGVGEQVHGLAQASRA